MFGKIVGPTSGIVFFLGLACALIFLGLTDGAHAGEKEVLIGQIADFTSPATSFAGKPFAYGVRDFFDSLNRKGGVVGHKVRYVVSDGGYGIPTEIATFKKIAMQKPVALVDWSTGSALQIAPMCTELKIVVFGGALLEMLSDPKKYPYRFIHAATYEQCWRAMIEYHLGKHKGPQRAAITYPDSGFGKVNADAIRARLAKMNIPLVDEEVIDFKALDATTQMLKMLASKPTLVLNAQVEASISVIMRDAAKVGFDLDQVQFYAPLNALGQELPELGGEPVKNLILGSPFSDVSETDVEGIREILAFNADKGFKPDMWYVHGWSAGSVITEGLRRMLEKGEKVTGENLKKALETVHDFSNKGLTAPVSFSAVNHIGARGAKLFRPDFKRMHGVEKVSDWVFPQ